MSLHHFFFSFLILTISAATSSTVAKSIASPKEQSLNTQLLPARTLSSSKKLKLYPIISSSKKIHIPRHHQYYSGEKREYAAILTTGNDENGGINSVHKREGFPYLYIALGVSICFLVLVLSLPRRFLRLWQQKKYFFQQNGGISLQQEISKHNWHVPFKILTAKELKKATNNYHESRVLGQGVYKGILPDGQIVAIKKFDEIGDQSQVERFVALSQINHKNVAKILGCCLETQTPFLVHEFVSKGTLFNHLHHHVSTASVLSWENRERIAAETAEAISYVHSIPIIHGDVKSTNILLDENYNAKVSAFGASRLVTPSDTAVFLPVPCHPGYTDDLFLQTGRLTEESDVYSFGVVLIELLTGLKAYCSQRPQQHKCLSVYFVSVMKENRLVDILDGRVVNEINIKHVKEVAVLASRCVRLNRKERPTMKEVASELMEGLRGNGETSMGKN